MSVTNIIANINYIPILNASNFKSWQENFLIVFVDMNLYLALKIDSSLSFTDESTPDDQREIERWERSNRMCIMIIKNVILKIFRA